MDIKDIKQAKWKLEQDIASLVLNFEKETQTEISDIYIQRQDLGFIKNTSITTIVNL